MGGKQSSQSIPLRSSTEVSGGVQSAGSTSGAPMDDSDGPSVQVSALPGRQQAMLGIKQVLHVLLQIRTPPSSRARLPLHVSCVMDKSGSMRGAKLKFAKRGVRKLIKHLTAEDNLNVIAYDNNVEVLFENGDLTSEGKEDLVQKVKMLATGGATNLCAGMDKGVSVLQSSQDRRDQEAASRLVCLFSDGLVNTGETDKAVILRKVRNHHGEGVAIYTFGIGTDFDEQLMRSIAREGHGEYAFLETAESIPKLVSKAVHGLIDLVGTEAVLEVQGLNGAVVTKVYGCEDDDDEMTGSPTLGQLRIGDLHADNVRQVLVELEVSPAAPPGQSLPESLPILSYNVSFNPCSTETTTSSAQDGAAASPGSCTSRQITGSVAIGFASDRSSVDEVNPHVAVAVAQQEAILKEEEVLSLLEENKLEQAIELKQRSIQALSALQERLSATAPEEVQQRLEKVLCRHRKALQSMQTEGRSMHTMLLEMRYERDIQERMSDRAYSEGCDSDESCWSNSDPGGLMRGMGNPQDSDGGSIMSDSS